MNMNRRKFLSSASKAASAVSLAKIFPALTRPLVLQPTASAKSGANGAKPELALTMDDPTLKLNSNMRWQEANALILKAISSRNVRAALFVCGMRVDEADGFKLVSAWDQAEHLIGNHSYSHLFYGEQTSYTDFAVDFLKNEKIIASYHNRAPLFRYPFLKEGDTAE